MQFQTGTVQFKEGSKFDILMYIPRTLYLARSVTEAVFRCTFVLNNFFCCKVNQVTSKEKHFLTRKLVGYRNWGQMWCEKKGNKVLRKG